VSSALDSFLDKWRERWPEWAFVERFVDEADRARSVAWFALLLLGWVFKPRRERRLAQAQ